jgi:microcystin-dependent protein
MINKNIIIVILLLVLVFLVNYNVLEPFQQFGDIDDLAVKGSPGANGPQGPQGSTGNPGGEGSQGVQGPLGPQGPQGPQGEEGPKGDRGQPGLQGIKGIVETIDGVQGIKGDIGPPGSDGTHGQNGADGTPGNPGQDGANGTPGQDGAKGDPGSDATNPRGLVSMWSGSETNVPDGWQLCDGKPFLKMDGNAELKNGNFVSTPDLRGRFILGSGQPSNTNNMHIHGGPDTLYPLNDDGSPFYHFTVGQTAGTHRHPLTVAEMPSHRHNLTDDEGQQHYAISDFNITPREKPEVGRYASDGPNESGSDTSIKRTQVEGDDQPHNNMPPYYVLAFIIKK